MPTAIPERFKLEMRLGRDEDIEEWLATDTSLDRPVLVRSLGPETSTERRSDFVASVSAMAKVTHPHLSKVFAVEQVDGGAYSVVEWTGGSTVADRVAASHPIDIPDFLPNAAGVAGALRALHDSGAVHGAIDMSSISYSAAHSAKLGGFGRRRRDEATGDVVALASALESALTGAPPGGPPPSERIDGVPRAIDRILRSAQEARLTAGQFEEALLAAPTPRVPVPEPRAGSLRLTVAAVSLVVLALGLVALGRVFTGGGPPILPAPEPITTVLGTDGQPVTSTEGPAEVGIENAASFDPFGEGGENDGAIINMVDGDISTVWQTERYQQPLSATKPGLGVTFTLRGTPGHVRLVGLTSGTDFELYWSDRFFAQLEDWSRVAGAVAPPGATLIDLPPRRGGFWLVWMTDLPPGPDGAYYTTIAEVRFTP